MFLDPGNSVGQEDCPPLSPLLYKAIQIPNARVKTLFTTALTLVPGQPNKIIFPEYFLFHKPAGTAFTGGTLINVSLGGAIIFSTFSVVNFMDQTTKRSFMTGRTQTGPVLATTQVGVDLNLQVTGSNLATSTDTDLFVSFIYRVWEDNPSPYL